MCSLKRHYNPEFRGVNLVSYIWTYYCLNISLQYVYDV
jgi:hypothetical protein